jgi:myo-inositol-1(or 4)-monophosphatase
LPIVLAIANEADAILRGGYGRVEWVHFKGAVNLVTECDKILGVVADPLREEYFTAVSGGGAALNGRPIRVSPTQRFEVSLLATGFPYDIRASPDTVLAHFTHFVARTQAVRRIGSAALNQAWTACGRFDGYWDGSCGCIPGKGRPAG